MSERLFVLDDLAAHGDRFRCRARVPEATPLVEGHFPGRAVVPGIGIVALIVEVLALGLGRPVELRAIDSIRFRAPVEPGSELQVEITAQGEKAQFRMATVAGELVANGSVRLAGGGSD
jgi:3-hydroxyacyl-[acyl-carrier-protein] dehydratase